MSLVVLFILAVITGIIVGMCNKSRKKNEFKKKLDAVYQNIFSEKFDAEAFIEKHKDVLDTLP